MSRDDTLQQVQELISRGEAEAAEALLRAHPDDPACQVRLRELLVGEGRDAEARALVEALAAGDGPEALVSRSILALWEGELDGALRATRAALEQQPRLATAHNHAGRALHNLGRTSAALEAFRAATRHADPYPEAWHNLGHALRAGGDTEGALAAFRRALELAPAYRQARRKLAATLFNADRVGEAREHFEALLAMDADDVDALLGLGLCEQLAGQFEAAQERFCTAVEQAPGRADAHLYLGNLRNEMLDTEGALASLRAATEGDPAEVDAWIALAGVLEQANRLDEATAALVSGFAVDRAHPGLHLEAARIERRRGQVDSAVRRLRAIDPATLPPRAAQQYHFELGLALDRAGEADAAVVAFATGNRLARGSVRSRSMDPAAFARRCERLEGWLEQGAPGALPSHGETADDAGEDLCFLVGFPRSGTTLIDTTLETHPEVVALEEAATLDAVIADLDQSPERYPWALASADGVAVGRWRELYRARVDSRLQGAQPALLVDKMPLRFMHAGLITRLFPASRMLFVLRHPCDVVLSNFMQQYAVNETNIHFDTLAHCAEVYDRLMRMWQAAEALLPLRLAYVRYEDLVADTERSIAGVCDFLGLEAGAVSLEREARLATRERVRTSSYQQVAEPIYRRAAGRWARYRRHLEPVLPLLAPHAERYGYSLDA